MAADPYKYFRVEARELLEQLGQGALDLEKAVPPPDLIAKLLRLTHTLKGAARVVRQPEIAEETHQLETLFGTFRGATARIPRQQIDLVLSMLDQLGGRLARLAQTSPSAAPPPPDAALPVFRPEGEDLEALIDGAAEAQARLADLASRLRAAFGSLKPDIEQSLDRVERELRQVSDAATRLRLVPAGAIFRFLERAARDAAQALGKRVSFEGRGGDVRIDGGVLAIAQAALLQVVRNAVVHGIESTESERRAAGKTPEGHVTLAVARRGARISFVCSDDGCGVDVEAVRRILDRKGLSLAGRDALDTAALLKLLLEGGITTARSVTDVAGRGIGLDVAREAAERLGGEITMRSAPGQGTSVDLLVPVSIAAFEALLVEVANIGAAIPLDAVRRTVRVTPDTIMETAEGDRIVDGERSIPFSSLLRIVQPAAPRTRATQPASAFVVESGGAAAAFAIERILGTAAVVTRRLPEVVASSPAVMGAALDPTGRARLVLDPAQLVAVAHQPDEPRRQTEGARPAILVVDDSLTTRMLERSILESAGYDVGVASSGEEGLDKARSGNYALFLVDIEMPGMDGFAFIEHLRADPALRTKPAILVTSRESAQDRERGRAVGAQGYVVKSEFDQRALLERIQGFVS